MPPLDPASAPPVRPATTADRPAWDEAARSLRGGSLLSTWGWGDLKAAQGWEVLRLMAGDGAAVRGTLWLQLRHGPLGVAFAYAPRGPLVADPGADGAVATSLIAAARVEARRRRALVLKIDPEWLEDDLGGAAVLRAVGAQPSWYDVQHRRTYLVDITGGEDAVLGRFKESTRRAIRRCGREGVDVSVTHDPVAAEQELQPLMEETGRRSGFVPRVPRYYGDIVRLVGPSAPAVTVVARHEGRVVAALLALAVGPRLVYLYGGNRVSSGSVHPAYAAQWAAIRWGIEQGCSVYDMWGVPNHEDPSVPGYGYYEFKTRFNGHVVRHIRCQDVPLRPLGPLPRLAERVALRGRPLIT